MKKGSHRTSGFTLVEVLIVCGSWPSWPPRSSRSLPTPTSDAKLSTAKFNLQTCRSQIEMIQVAAQRPGAQRGAHRTVQRDELRGHRRHRAGTSFPYGPYMVSIPLNYISNSTTVAALLPTASLRRRLWLARGWLYDITTGKIWFNDTGTPQLYPFTAQ